MKRNLEFLVNFFALATLGVKELRQVAEVGQCYMV